MRKVIAILLVGALLSSPLLLHNNFPDLYGAIGQLFPNTGVVIIVILDIGWLWFVLFLFYVLTSLAWRIKATQSTYAHRKMVESPKKEAIKQLSILDTI